MEGLSASLIAKVQARPLNTVLNDETEKNHCDSKRYISRVGPINIPKSFNGPSVWKDYLTKIRNQGKCGSCWAWATVSVLGDRFNLMTNNKAHVELSPLRPLLCDLDGAEWEIKYPEFADYTSVESKILAKNIGKIGCKGSTLCDAWKYLYTIGTNSEDCLSYFEKGGFDIVDYSDDSQLPLCSDVTGSEGDMCGGYYRERETGSETGIPGRFFRAISFYSVPGTLDDLGTERDIMREIYNYGPVSAAMRIYADFYTFDPKKTIYRSSEIGPPISGHAVRILGWGEENDVKFWWVANSWGKSWGINGYFKMIRGVNNCAIEGNVWAAFPDIFYPLGIILPSFMQKTIEAIPTNIRTKRLKIDYGDEINGGGLDPRTGYTRRAQYRYTGFKEFRPLLTVREIIDILDKPFVAGKLNPVVEKFVHEKQVLESVNIFLIIFCTVSFLILIMYCLLAVKVRSD